MQDHWTKSTVAIWLPRILIALVIAIFFLSGGYKAFFDAARHDIPTWSK